MRQICIRVETERGITEMRPDPEKHETDMRPGRERAGHN